LCSEGKSALSGFSHFCVRIAGLVATFKAKNANYVLKIVGCFDRLDRLTLPTIELRVWFNISDIFRFLPV